MERNLLKLNITIEKAVRFLCKHFSESRDDSKKPRLSHSLRVGFDVYQRAILNNNYSNEIVVGAFLHDVIEWSSAHRDRIEKEFGDKVLRLVLANTKDRSIEDGKERIAELAYRCAQVGEEAFIIRSVDTLDSFRWYTAMENDGELEYCKRSAQAILEYKKDIWNDPVFEEVKNMVY